MHVDKQKLKYGNPMEELQYHLELELISMEK